MLGQLVPCGGGPPIDLHKPKLVVGRRHDCDVSVPMSTVSSRHCRLEFKDGCCFVEDMDSRNGIRVNGTRVHSSQLMPGDTLSIAQHRYQIVYQATAKKRVEPEQPVAAANLKAPVQETDKDKSTPRPKMGPTRLSRQYSQLGRMIPCGGGDPIPLLKSRVVVGRKSGCDIVLRFTTVSSRHCELEFKSGYWLVRDLGSRNGIRVNGVREKSKCVMPHDVLSIAKHRYEIVYEPQGEEPPPEEDPFALSLLEKAGLQKAAEGETRPSWMVDDGHVPTKKWTLDE